MAGAKVKIKAAAEVFRTHYYDLSKQISLDPFSFAMALYSKRIINHVTLNKIAPGSSHGSAPGSETAYTLLSAVTKGLKSRPTTIDPDALIDTLCSVLNELDSNARNDIARSIQDDYKEQLTKLNVQSPRKRISGTVRTDLPTVPPNMQALATTSLNNAESTDDSIDKMSNPDHPKGPHGWIMPKLSPYLPQIGDVVMYFWQGHQKFIQEAGGKIGNLRLPKDKSKLSTQECCQVMDIKYIVGTPTLYSLVLQSSSETKFTVKYQDMNGIPDFIVLKSVYDVAMSTSWSAGNKFKSLINDDYFYGKVLSVQPFDDNFPDSDWQCYRIQWDDEKDAVYLSSWEMEKTKKNISSMLLEAIPSVDESEKRRILHGLDYIAQLDEAFQFQYPVEVQDVPKYYKKVAFPINLSTIRKRLNNDFYRCKEALLWEVFILQKNAIAFNEANSLIVEHAKILVQTLWKFIIDSAITDPSTCYEPVPSKILEEGIEIAIGLMPTPCLSSTEDCTSCTSEQNNLSENVLGEFPVSTSRRALENRRQSFREVQRKLNEPVIVEDNCDQHDSDYMDSQGNSFVDKESVLSGVSIGSLSSSCMDEGRRKYKRLRSSSVIILDASDDEENNEPSEDEEVKELLRRSKRARCVQLNDSDLTDGD